MAGGATGVAGQGVAVGDGWAAAVGGLEVTVEGEATSVGVGTAGVRLEDVLGAAAAPGAAPGAASGVVAEGSDGAAAGVRDGSAGAERMVGVGASAVGWAAGGRGVGWGGAVAVGAAGVGAAATGAAAGVAVRAWAVRADWAMGVGSAVARGAADAEVAVAAVRVEADAKRADLRAGAGSAGGCATARPARLVPDLCTPSRFSAGEDDTITQVPVIAKCITCATSTAHP